MGERTNAQQIMTNLPVQSNLPIETQKEDGVRTTRAPDANRLARLCAPLAGNHSTIEQWLGVTDANSLATNSSRRRPPIRLFVVDHLQAHRSYSSQDRNRMWHLCTSTQCRLMWLESTASG